MSKKCFSLIVKGIAYICYFIFVSKIILENKYYNVELYTKMLTLCVIKIAVLSNILVTIYIFIAAIRQMADLL